MYNWVKPRSVIPVHGEHRHMKEHINFAKELQIPYPLRIENGDIVQLYPGNDPRIVDKAPTGRMYLDGNISVSEDYHSIKERKNLAYNGFLEITIIADDNGTILSKPIVSFRGIPISEEEAKDFTMDLEDEISKVCKTFSINNSKQEYNLINTLKSNCRKAFKEKTGKKPYTNVNFVRI